MMDQLNHLIDTTFSDVEKFKSSNRRYTLQSLYAALDHQLQDGLRAQHEYMIYSTESIRLETADSCDRSGTIVAVTS